MPACTLSRAPLSCSTGRTRRSVVLASAPSHTPSHLCERPLAELAAERWPSAAAAALCARSTRRPFHAALGHGAAAAHRCGKAAQGRTARACGTRHRGRRARRAAARGLCRECCLFACMSLFPRHLDGGVSPPECSGHSLPMRVSRALRGLMGGLPACRIGGKAPTPRRAVATGAERARGQGAASISTGARAGSTALASPRDVLHFWFGDTTWALPPKARAAAMADKAYLKVLLAHSLCAPFLRPAGAACNVLVCAP